MSEDPALGQKNVHAPACLVWLLFIGWKVEIMVNLLRKLFRLFESWSLLLVKHGQSKNVKSSGPKRKTIKHAQVSKKISSLSLGPSSYPPFQGLAQGDTKRKSIFLISPRLDEDSCMYCVRYYIIQTIFAVRRKCITFLRAQNLADNFP